MQETLVRFLGWEDPLEKGWATHSRILGLPMWLRQQRIHLQCRRPGLDTWVGTIPWRRERLPTPGFWPEEFHGLYIHGVAKSRTRLRDFHFHFQLTTIFRRSDYVPFVAKLYNPAPPPPPQSSFSELSEVLSPRLQSSLYLK